MSQGHEQTVDEVELMDFQSGDQQGSAPSSTEDFTMVDMSQVPSDQDLYMAGAGGQDHSTSQNFTSDRTQSSESQPNEGINGPVVTIQPTSYNEQHLSKMRHDHLDLYTADAGGQDHSTTQNFTSDRTHSSESQPNEVNFSQGINGPVVTIQPTSYNEQHIFKMGHDHLTPPSSSRDPKSLDLYTAGAGGQNFTSDRTHSSESQPNEDLYTAGTGGQDHRTTQNVPMDRTNSSESQGNEDSRTTVDVKKNQKITTGQTHKSDSQSDEDDCKGGDKSQPSAPLDIAKFIIKVDWTEPFPDRWKTTLQKAIQSWLLKNKETASVHSLKLMGDQSYAEVEITPSTDLEALKKLKVIPLNFKPENKEVTARICPDEPHSVTGQQNPSMPDKNKISSAKVNSDVPVTSAALNDHFEGVAPANSGLTVPLYQFWYMNHAYRKELEQIQQKHGVAISSEVSVSIKPVNRSSPDSVSKASDDFQKLVQGCVDSFSEADINHNHMNSDIVKQALHHIQSEETKMMFTMSASDCLFFGPKKFTDVIKRGVEETRMERQFNDKSSQMNEYNYPLDMDTKDLPTQLEMDKVHWDLMKLSYKEQIVQLEAKYGVSFDEEKLQKNLTIKVQARSRGVQHINLESHAIRALTQLYQKLASAAVTCELRDPADAAVVGSTVEKLQQLHRVVVEDGFSPSRLVGLPEHLGPAIAEIEKMLQKRVFDDKMKTLIGYSGDIPHARGINWIPMHDYGSGAVGGSEQDEGVNFRRRIEADSGFNKDSKDSSKHESKDAHAEEETCVICIDSFTNKKKLKCGHEFCRDCISASEKSLGSICPVCKEVYGKLEGNQPAGTMNVTKSSFSLSGYAHCGTIEIYYDIPSGVQTKKHPNPGKPFYGTTRKAYLPDNHEGREVLTLLQRAFQQKLIFTVGKSTTTGADNMVTWNDIHHKTNIYGGPERYGYPDPDYLKRVKDELKTKGIE